MDTTIEDALQRIMFALAEESDAEMRSAARRDVMEVTKAYADLEQKLNGTAPVTSGIEMVGGKPTLLFDNANTIDEVED